KTQAPFSEPAHRQRVDQVFLAVYPLGQAFDGVVSRHRYHSLYDQWAAIEFLSHEVDAAAMLGVACLQRPTVGMQAFVLGQQRRVNVEQAALIVAHEVATEDTHEA